MKDSSSSAIAPPVKPKYWQSVWFALSLLVAVIFALLTWQQAFRAEYVVDSDARQHVFWMQRFLDPTLFPNDFIADYHQSVAPFGYAKLYWLFAQFGVNPFLLNKFLPLILGVVATGYCFFICLEILPIPIAGFAASLLLNQALWMRYDLVSGTARSFIYPLLLMFLYYLMRRSLVPCLLAIALQGLFYPQCVFISAGILILTLFSYKKKRIQISQNQKDYWLCFSGLGVAFFILLPYALQTSAFDPVTSVQTARLMPEFQPTGRTRFFHENPLEFWLFGKRSSILPNARELPPLIWTGVLLPLYFNVSSRLPLSQEITSQITLLVKVVFASLGMFFIAHLLLFQLHLPSRYTMHSLLIVLSLLAGVFQVVLLDGILHWTREKHYAVGGFILFLSLSLWIYPFFTAFPYSKYKQGEETALYEFLARQPQDILVAGVVEEADNIPSFARRSVLTSEMYAIPYHEGYYNEIRQRTEDSIHAQYSPDAQTVTAFIQKYGVDFWLVDRHAFSPAYLAGNGWLMQFEQSKVAIALMEQGISPLLITTVPSCSTLETESLLVLQGTCIVDTLKPSLSKP